MSLLMGFIGITKKYMASESSDDYMNFNDVAVTFMKKCALLDTIEGVFLINYLAN